ASQLAAPSWQRGVRGVVFETTRLRSIQIPERFLQPGPLSLCVSVTFRRAEGAPWAHYVVGILFPD
ncbi:MAG: hypothetical protein AAGE52_37390, partial [Myxococcota bacterium]